MIKSEPILPIRIYDSLYDQQRFNVHCSKAEQFDLIFPKTEFPYFQYKRASSLTAPAALLLKPVCGDYTRNVGTGNITTYVFKELNEQAANFGNYAADQVFGPFPIQQGGIYDNGVDPPNGVLVDAIRLSGCNSIVGPAVPIDDFITLSAWPEMEIPLSSASNYYHFKIIVEKLIRDAGSTFTIKVYNGGTGGTLLASITAAGIYNVDFTSIANDITIVLQDIEGADEFEISYVQATINKVEDANSFIELDETKLKVIPLADGNDLIVYCEPNQSYVVPPGEYYYAIVDNGIFYYSEVFRIVSLKQIEKYYRLKWYSDCDINNSVCYNATTLSCTYFNQLFLDAALFKPEPESKEEGEESGTGDLNVTYKSWKKSINFEIPKSPEFLTDALSAVFLHQTILIRKPLNDYQDTNNSEFQVRRVVPEVTQVLQDYFQKVNLKLLVNENYYDTGCCNEIEQFDCTPCDYVSVTGGGGEYELIVTNPPDPDDGLYKTPEDTLVEVEPDQIICHDDGFYYQLEKVGDDWQVSAKMPSITNVSISVPNYVIVGKAIPLSWAVLQYRINGGVWVTASTNAVDSNGSWSAHLATSTSTGATDFDLRIHNISKNCDFGYSDEWDYI